MHLTFLAELLDWIRIKLHCLITIGNVLIARFAVKCSKKTPTFNIESQKENNSNQDSGVKFH